MPSLPLPEMFIGTGGSVQSGVSAGPDGVSLGHYGGMGGTIDVSPTGWGLPKGNKSSTRFLKQFFYEIYVGL